MQKKRFKTLCFPGKTGESEIFAYRAAALLYYDHGTAAENVTNADKARRFIDNLRMCQINVIVTDEEDVKSSTEYYIDVNLKGIPSI